MTTDLLILLSARIVWNPKFYILTIIIVIIEAKSLHKMHVKRYQTRVLLYCFLNKSDRLHLICMPTILLVADKTCYRMVI